MTVFLGILSVTLLIVGILIETRGIRVLTGTDASDAPARISAVIVSTALFVLSTVSGIGTIMLWIHLTYRA